ncbi:hypothetical protein DER45DRAFT_184878 [Fusarium avenaceum]|nr:hypothetical protein DER45DRAFT_184878 [Fusarium avenaceum]
MQVSRLLSRRLINRELLPQSYLVPNPNAVMRSTCKASGFSPKSSARHPHSPPSRASINFERRPLELRFLLFLFSLALFAFWLRSSVVSVLFSLISERSLRRPTLIIPIFGFRAVSSVLAHDPTHCVPGITLPPGDANYMGSVFHYLLGLARVVKKIL